MRKLTILIVFLLVPVAVFAQTYLDVPPGYGTLNDSISAHQGNVIYRLEAGGWYGLNGVIENNGFPLTIIGTKPSAGEMPAEIQDGVNSDGTVQASMFNLLGDLTLKNVYIIGADQNNDLCPVPIVSSVNQPIRIVIDSATIDPSGLWALISMTSVPTPTVKITNSLILRTGTLTNPYDGNLIDFTISPGNGYDTLYLENNTFVSTGMLIGINSVFTADSENFIWINHNTWIFHKEQGLWAWHTNKYFVTNNLFFDFDTSPTPFISQFSFPDGDTVGVGKYFAWVNDDTTSSDSSGGKLLSPRKLFVEYNSVYTDTAILNLVNWAATHTVNNDGTTPIPKDYQMPLMWPQDSAGVNREASMCSDKAHFPYFMEGHYLDNSMGNHPNTDPQWTDPKFYAYQDSLVSYAFDNAKLNIWNFTTGPETPPLQFAGNWFWCLDSTYNLGNPTVWPRINCAYNNPMLLKGSIEGLPLGDLNWFPKAKTLWEQNRTDAMSWILNEDTSQFVLTGIQTKGNNNELPSNFTLSQNYPNPFNPTTIINYSIPKAQMVTLRIYNILGQEVTTLVNQEQSAGNYKVTFDASNLASGVYFYSFKSGNFTSVKKMMLLK